MNRILVFAAVSSCLLYLAATSGSAKECKQVDGSSSLQCREVSDLGSQYCLVPEDIAIRAVTPGTVDPWVTKKDIGLKKFSTGPHPVPSSCKPAITFVGAEVTITQPGGYHINIAKMAMSGVAMTGTADLQPHYDGNHDIVWLAGTDSAHSNIEYFVLFRDEPYGAKPLPKFLVVEAFDTSVSGCHNNAPSEQGNVVLGGCSKLAPKKIKTKSGGFSETGVGGGGEGKP